MGSIRHPIRGQTSPGEPDGSVQYNDDGDFAGDLTFTFDDVLKIVTMENAQINNNAVVEGNLTVNGSIVSIDSESLNIGDNHIYLNAAYTGTSAETGGIVVNISATGLFDTVTAGTFTAGVLPSSNPTVITDDSAKFSTNDIVQLSGFTENNGIYEVLSHIGTTLTIRGIGATPTVEDWTNNQFADTSDTGRIDKVNVTVLLANDNGDGKWGSATGNTTSIGTPFNFIQFVEGPDTSIDAQFPLFSGITGDLLAADARVKAISAADNFVTLTPLIDVNQDVDAIHIRLFDDTTSVFNLGFEAAALPAIKYNTHAAIAEFLTTNFFSFTATTRTKVLTLTNDVGSHFLNLGGDNPNTSFLSVNIGDFYKDVITGSWFTADGTASTSWSQILTSSDGVVIGPGSSVTNEVALYADTTGEALDSNASVLITSDTNEGFHFKALTLAQTVTVLDVDNSAGSAVFTLSANTDTGLVELNAPTGNTITVSSDQTAMVSRTAPNTISVSSTGIIANFTNTVGTWSVNAHSTTPVGVIIPTILGEFLLAADTGDWYKANGTTTFAEWDVILTSGDLVVIGPGSSIDNELVLFDGTTGELVKGGTPFRVSAAGDIFSSGTLASITNQGADGILLQSYKTGEDSSDFTNTSTVEAKNTEVSISSLVGDAAGATVETVSITVDAANGSAEILLTDEAASRGALYAADYSANFEARSLVDKGYVDSEIADATTGNSADTQVIVNQEGVLTGDADFTWNDATLVLTLGQQGTAQSQSLAIPRDGTTPAGAFPHADAAVHMKGSETNPADIYLDSQSNTSTEAPNIVMRRARDTGAPGVGNYYGSWIFQGYDGTSSYYPAAYIRALSPVAGGAADMPGALTFGTTPSGSSASLERMRILDDGAVGIGTTTPASLLDVDGSFAVRRVGTAVSVATADEVIIGVTDTTATRTVTIQTADIVAGRIFIIKDESGAAGTNNITVATQAAQTIDGLASVDITVDYGALRLYSDGSNLFIW
jgi:hypothetical protein